MICAYIVIIILIEINSFIHSFIYSFIQSFIHSTLTKVASPKYLGVIVDHITYVKNKISKGIGIMYKARRYLNKVSLKNLYYAYMYPYFTYCIEVWGSAAKCHVNSLFLLQKKNIRIMTFSPTLHIQLSFS